MSSEFDQNQYRQDSDMEQQTGGYNNSPQASGYSNPPQTGGAYHYSSGNIPGETRTEDGYYAQGTQSGPVNQPPQPPQPPYQSPMAGYNVTPSQPQKKSSGGGKKIIAVAIICALIGGIGGGAAVGMALRNDGGEKDNAVMEEQSLPEEAEEPQEEVNETFRNTVIDVTTNSEATDMTPQDVYEHYVNAVVAISNEGTTTNIFGQISETASSGSGFIISEDGYIVTNNHVVSKAQTLTVTMTNGEEYPATIIGADSQNDVALIKIDATGLPTVSIGDSDSIEVGQQVCAIGNPLGELTNTLTVGYVSALDREINENGTPINMFQTDCAINSGNSGGPIFDMHGNVIGITTAKYSSNGYISSASIEGIGFCIPVDDAMDIVSDLLEYGYVKGRPALGITCENISSTVTQYYNLPKGAYVRSVSQGSAAEKAGLQEGDIICAIDGQEISGVTALKALLKDYTAGDTATLSVYRSETHEELELEITFDEMTSQTGTQTQIPETTQSPNGMS